MFACWYLNFMSMFFYNFHWIEFLCNMRNEYWLSKPLQTESSTKYLFFDRVLKALSNFTEAE